MNFKQKKFNIIESKKYINFFGKSKMKNLKSKIKISIFNILTLFCRDKQGFDRDFTRKNRVVCRVFTAHLPVIYGHLPGSNQTPTRRLSADFDQFCQKFSGQFLKKIKI